MKTELEEQQKLGFKKYRTLDLFKICFLKNFLFYFFTPDTDLYPDLSPNEV